MLQTLKKYWFVCLVGVLLIGASIYFAYYQNKGKLPGKSVGGEDVVFSIGDEDITAGEFYDTLFNEMGVAGVYQFMEKAVVDPSIETTEEMKTQAQSYADSITAQYQSTYGDQYKEMLLTALNGVGYSKLSDLTDYFIHIQKTQQMIKDYINAHADEYIPAYVEAKKPRIVSHILIKMDDPANPTEEETNRVNAVKDALASGRDFGEVAQELSEDSGSAVQNGSIGYMDADSQLVSPFLETALAMNEGEVSEWIQTTYGWHIIKCDVSATETLKGYDEFYDALATYYPNLQPKVVWEKAQEMNLDFKGNDELQNKLLIYMGLNEKDEPETQPETTENTENPEGQSEDQNNAEDQNGENNGEQGGNE